MATTLDKCRDLHDHDPMKTSATHRLHLPPFPVGILVLIAAVASCTTHSEPEAAAEGQPQPTTVPAPLTPLAREKLKAQERAEVEATAFKADLRRFGSDGLEAGIGALDDARVRAELHLQRLTVAARTVEPYAPNIHVEIERRKIQGRICKEELARLRKIGDEVALADIERATMACRAYSGQLQRFVDELIDFGQRNRIDIEAALGR